MMKRAAVLLVTIVLVIVALPGLALAVPSLNASLGSGLPGTVISVTGADFSPGLECTLHLGSLTLSLDTDPDQVGTCSVNGSRVLTGSFVVPDWSVGNYALWACNGSVGNLCSYEFEEKASTPFTINAPPDPPTITITIPEPTPTVTVPPLDLGPDYTPSGACPIPGNAIVLDFDDVSTGPVAEFDDAWRRLAWSQFYLTQADHFQVSRVGTRERPDRPPFTGPTTVIAGNPARDLTTSSPPNVLRMFDEGRFSVSSYLVLDQMDYFGFNVGFGHFSEGFENPETVVLDVSIRMLPVQELDGTVTAASWAPVTVTLGPGPQPVDTCVLLENTAGVGHPLYSTWLIDVFPRNLDGTPIHIPIDIDDVFYGSNSLAPAGCAIPAGADVIDFDDLPTGWARWDETFVAIPTGSGNSFRFGFYDNITESAGGGGVATLPYRSTDVGIGSVAPGTVSPPNAASGDGYLAFTIDQGVDYVGLHMGWPVSDSLGPLSLFAEAGSLRFDITARNIPVQQLDGTVFSAELARTAIELGPDFSPIDHCVILDLSTLDLHPTFDSVIVEIAASYRGVPNDWRTVIDDVFFGSGPAPATTDVTVAAATSTTSVPDPTTTTPAVADSGSSALIPALLALGGLIVGVGAVWWARKPR